MPALLFQKLLSRGSGFDDFAGCADKEGAGLGADEGEGKVEGLAAGDGERGWQTGTNVPEDVIEALYGLTGLCDEGGGFRGGDFFCDRIHAGLSSEGFDQVAGDGDAVCEGEGIAKGCGVEMIDGEAGGRKRPQFQLPASFECGRGFERTEVAFCIEAGNVGRFLGVIEASEIRSAHVVMMGHHKFPCADNLAYKKRSAFEFASQECEDGAQWLRTT